MNVTCVCVCALKESAHIEMKFTGGRVPATPSWIEQFIVEGVQCLAEAVAHPAVALWANIVPAEKKELCVCVCEGECVRACECEVVEEESTKIHDRSRPRPDCLAR